MGSFEMKGGYTLASDAQLQMLDASLKQLEAEGRLDEARAAICVGVVSDAQVTSAKWGTTQLRDPELTVSQVFAAACAVQYNSKISKRSSWSRFAQLVLEASYEATLWVTLLSACRHGGAGASKRVYLTSLGGGVFGNSAEWIAHAMGRTFHIFQDYDLDVRIVRFNGTCDRRYHQLEKDFKGQ